MTQGKMTGSLKQSLDVFSCLCGDSAYPRIALGTTKWTPVESGAETRPNPPERQAERFELLKTKYWKDLIRSGSTPYQIKNENSALELVRSILDRLNPKTEEEELALELPKEVVDKGKTVPKTKAGMILERERRKNLFRFTLSMSEEEKFIQEQVDEIDRELKKLANKTTFIQRVAKVFTAAYVGSSC